ncbi:hypothetical protein TSEDIMI_220034 [Tenacibaculum sediminilitoris]|uniref:hypothetical protein n=1 Tax=Tenacibaculum sediminilitoris TaxID=1820334 RepID=UPI003893A917
MKNNIIVIILIFLIYYSCNLDDKLNKAYYPSGNLKFIEYLGDAKKLDSSYWYYDNSKKVLKTKVLRRLSYDSIIHYYKNGNTFNTGKETFDGLKFGNWTRYTKEGYKSDIREYFIIKNKSIINRRFYFNKQGDTVWYGRKFNRYDQNEYRRDTTPSRNSIMVFFDFYHGDTISLKEPFASSVRCGTPLLREYNSEITMLLAKEDDNFNERFSNENEVKLDTFRNIKYDKDNIDNFTGPDKQYVAVFGRWFKTPGEKTLRGYMLEHAKNDSVSLERRVYFEKKIYVKDTIK